MIIYTHIKLKLILYSNKYIRRQIPMQNKLEQAINILEKNNQLQVAKLIKVLNKEKQEKLVNQVLSIDFEQLNNLYHKATQKPEILEKKIEHIKYVDRNKLSEEELNLY